MIQISSPNFQVACALPYSGKRLPESHLPQSSPSPSPSSRIFFPVCP
ncbi:hypothetical protein [Eikenella corrodens]|nr:hypothetical protein [Eikenella corrodens]